MKRLSILVAALVVAAMLSLPNSTRDATAQEGGLTGDLAPVGVSLATWGGGDADAVVAAAATAGCNLASFWANVAAGGLVGYIPTNIQVVNQPFLAEFPDGEIPAATPLLIVCREGEVTPPPPPPMAELPESSITALIDQAYKFDSGGTPRTFLQAEFPVEVGTVTARWYTADGFYVVGYEGVDLSETGPLCPGNSIVTTAGFENITNDPTDDTSTVCGSVANLAEEPAGVQTCGDLLLYVTEIPTTAVGTLYGTIEIILEDGGIIGMTGTVESDIDNTPLIDIAAVCS